MQKIILLAEDNLDHAELISDVIEDAGLSYKIQHVSTGKALLEFLKASSHAPPSLILLDLKMPGMDGLETLELIRKSDTYESIPIIILSTSCSQEDKERSLFIGADGYLTKPDDFGKLISEIQKYIG